VINDTRPGPSAIKLLLVAACFAGMLCTLIRAYWRFQGYGSSAANGFALAVIVFPVALLALWAAAFTFLRSPFRIGSGRLAAWGNAVVAMILLLVLGFALEVWRTSHLRTESGTTILDFVRSLL